MKVLSYFPVFETKEKVQFHMTDVGRPIAKKKQGRAEFSDVFYAL